MIKSFFSIVWSILTSKRMKALYWSTSMMILALIIGQLSTNIDVLVPYVSPATITMLGLILAQISKGLNNLISGK